MKMRGPVSYNYLAQDGIFVNDHNCANAYFRMAFSSALPSSILKLSVDMKWTAAECTKMKTARAKRANSNFHR